MMRRPLQIVVGCVLVLTCLPPLFAQKPRRGVAKHGISHSPLLSRHFGEVVAETALATHSWDYYGFDCSHFVQAIFDAVGLPFEYANSIKLYNGADDFRRVFHPQPGDLIVWRGHVGIVVDPEEHSFYSMLRKGLRLSTYDSTYWRSRGQTRFLRYAGPAVRHPRSINMARLQAGQ